jgi:AcrR family transcriptional regulator
LKTAHYRPEILQQLPLSSKRIQILEGYLSLCLEIGVSEVTMDKIARKLNLSLGSIHYHFGGKEKLGLMESSIRYVSQESIKFINFELEQRLASDNFAGMSDYIDIAFKWIKTFPHHSRFYLHFYYLGSIDSHYADYHAQYLDLMRSRLTGLLFQGVGRGVYPELTNVEGLALKIHPVIVGSVLLSLLDPVEGSSAIHHQRTLDIVSELIKNAEIK